MNNRGARRLGSSLPPRCFPSRPVPVPAFPTPRPALVRERARHVGDPVALVVATSPWGAFRWVLRRTDGDQPMLVLPKPATFSW